MSSSIDYKVLASWCQDAISILASTGVPDKIVGMQRTAVVKLAGSPALYSIADSLAEGLSHLPDEERVDASKVLIERHGFDFNLFVDRNMRKVCAVLRRGSIKNDSEFRVLADFSSDTIHDRMIVDLADGLLASYQTSKRASEDSDLLRIAKQMAALSPLVSLIDSQAAEEILAAAGKFHTENSESVHWWTALRSAETIHYGDDVAAWENILSQKIGEMDGNSLFVAITDDEQGPWPVLRLADKLILVELIQSLHYFEYMAFQEDGRRLLFDTHHNTIVFFSAHTL